ncbi:MAG: porin family protein [Saprospiraceae bacterium]
MKNLLSVLALLFIFSSANAQFGIKAGINKSNIATDNEDIEDLESKKGFQLGVVYNLNLTKTLALRPEMLYVRKGADYTQLGRDVEVSMDYVQIPLSFVLQPFDNGLNFHAGVQGSMLTNTKVVYENDPDISRDDYEAGKDNFEKFDSGWIVGIGYRSDRFLIELRYARSLTEFERRATITGLEIEPASKHYSLQASLSVFF